MSSWQPQQQALKQIVDTIVQSTNEHNSQQVQHGITEVRLSQPITAHRRLMNPPLIHPPSIPLSINYIHTET